MTANCASISGEQSTLAPTSSTTTGFPVPVGRAIARAGRSTPRTMPWTIFVVAMTAPVLPAETTPMKISVGVWIADITKIDSVAQTFSANFVLVMRWHDARLAHAGPGSKRYPLEEVWHPPWLLGNTEGGVERSLPETVDVAADGSVLYRQRIVGSFAQALDLRAFPFDHDTFRIHVVVPGYTPEDIEFLPDPIFVAKGFSEGAGIAPELTMQEWRVDSPATRALPYIAGPDVRVAGYACEFTAFRNTRHFIVKVIIPLFLIVMMSWTVFWIEPTNSGSQISLAVTTVLTLIAYRFAVDAEVPKLPYTTRLDAFILASTLLVFGSLVEVIVTTNLAEHGRIDFARAIDRRSRVIVPIVFLILSAICFLYWPPRALSASTGP